MDVFAPGRRDDQGLQQTGRASWSRFPSTLAKPPGVWLLAAWCGLASPAHAQAGLCGETGLRARMGVFVRAIPDDGPTDAIRRFFPTTGDWSYSHAVHQAGGGIRLQRWVFPAAQTSRLFGFDSDVAVDPVWDSFLADQHGQIDGLLISAVDSDRQRPWRRVGGSRFVPPGAPASSRVFVEWRRERGRWVISAFGDERFCGPRLPGYELGEAVPVRSLPAPARPAYAADERWYVNSETLRFDGQRHMKYGQPRDLQPSDLEPVGWKGDVCVYAEKGRTRSPEILYVPAAPDSYQPYQAYGRGRDPTASDSSSRPRQLGWAADGKPFHAIDLRSRARGCTSLIADGTR